MPSVLVPLLLALLPAAPAGVRAPRITCHEAGRRFAEALLANDPRRMSAARRDLATAYTRAVARAPRAAATERCARLYAQALWKNADGHARAKRYLACYRSYASLARRFPRFRQAEAFHYNAALCARLAGRLQEAYRFLRELVKRYPRSSLAGPALLQVAQYERDRARFAEAARLYTQYADRAPGSKHAMNALHTAVVLWAGLGDPARLRRAVQAFERRYGLRQPRRAATVAWVEVERRLRAGPTRDVPRVLSRWLKRYGRTARPAQVMVARYRLGQWYWRQSCPVPGVDGLCVRSPRRRRGMAGALRLVKRKRARVSGARREARAILRLFSLWSRVAAVPLRATHPALVQQARQAAAWAQFLEAEVRLEPFLRAVEKRRRPGGNPGRGSAPANRLPSQAATLHRAYGEVIRRIRVSEDGTLRGDPRWTLAALARQGRVLAALGRTQRAVQELRACQRLAVRLRMDTPWVRRCHRLCHRLCHRIAPRRCPRDAERFAPADRAGVQPAPATFRAPFGRRSSSRSGSP